MARQNGDTHQESYVPIKIKAAQLTQLKAKRDTNIIGSTVSGKKVEVDTGRDLHIQSLQDVDNFKEHSKSAGFSVSSKPNFKNPTGSINASVGRIDSKWKSVTEQAGIYAGEEGYNLNVGNGTTLEGAVIKSEAPKAKNKLTTKSLEMKDIQNEAEYTYSNNGIGYNYYGSKKKLEEMKAKDKKGYDKIYNSIGLVPNLGVGSKDKASSTTQSAISDGILTVDGKEIDTKTINTNTENTLHQLDKIFDKKKIEERQELARLFSKNAFEQLHNWQPTTKEGKVAKSIAHGIIGEVAARMAGNSPGSGFKATMTNELLIGEIKKVAKHDPALAQWLSAAVGGVVNKVGGESSNSGAAVASYATKWNSYLFEDVPYSNYYLSNKKDNEIRDYNSGYTDDDVKYARQEGTLKEKDYFINLANIATAAGGPGMALKMAAMDEDEIVENYADDITVVGYRDYIISPNNTFGRAITESILYQQAVNEAIEKTVESGIRNRKVEYTVTFKHDSLLTKIFNLGSFVSAGKHTSNIDVMIDDSGIHVDTYTTDIFNFERGAGGSDPIREMNDNAALSMQAGILKQYKWHLYNHLDY